MVRSQYKADLIPYNIDVYTLGIELAKGTDLVIYLYGRSVDKIQVPSDKYLVKITDISTTVTIDYDYFSTTSVNYSHILFVRETEIEQTMNASSAFPLNRESLEQALDRVTMILQEHKYNIQNMLPRLTGKYNETKSEWYLKFNDLNGAFISSPNLIGPSPDVEYSVEGTGIIIRFQIPSYTGEKLWTPYISLGRTLYDDVNNYLRFLSPNIDDDPTENIPMPDIVAGDGKVSFYMGNVKMWEMYDMRAVKVQGPLPTSPERIDIYGANNLVNTSFYAPCVRRDNSTLLFYGGDTSAHMYIPFVWIQDASPTRKKIVTVSDTLGSGQQQSDELILPSILLDSENPRKVIIGESGSLNESEFYIPSVTIDPATNVITAKNYDDSETSLNLGTAKLNFRGEFEIAPENPELNWCYYNTLEKKTYIYNGELWFTMIKDGEDGAGVPVGTVLILSGSDEPNGTMSADGQAISRADYAVLNAKYSAQSYPYGDGDGSTTFNLPDLNSTSTMRHVIQVRNVAINEDVEGLDQRVTDLETEVPLIDGRLVTAEALLGLGGIIEEGSNANGYWVKFANGLMVCMLGFGATLGASGQVYLNLTYPKAFISLIGYSIGVLSGNSDGYAIATIHNNQLETAACRIINLWVGSSYYGVNMAVWGRWK